MIQVTNERMKAYVEVLAILNNMEEKYIKKIPDSVKEFFKEHGDKEYKFHLKPNLPLEKQDLNPKTLDVLAMLNLNYWCENNEHKQELLQKYRENELRYQDELKEKYNVQDLFKNRIKVEPTEENINEIVNLPQEYIEEKWYKKIFGNIINRIRNFFNKN